MNLKECLCLCLQPLCIMTPLNGVYQSVQWLVNLESLEWFQKMVNIDQHKKQMSVTSSAGGLTELSQGSQCGIVCLMLRCVPVLDIISSGSPKDSFHPGKLPCLP